jgi:ribosomal protein L40E
VTCGQCGSENPPTARFCLECGSPLALSRPSCHSPYAPEQKFCGECGAALTAAPPATPAGAEDSAPVVPTGPVPTAERRLVTVLFADAGRPDETVPLRGEAREIFERLRATAWLERLGGAEHHEPAAIST